MPVKELKFLSSPQLFAKHKQYHLLLDALDPVNHDFGYAFYDETETVFCLTAHHAKSESFPYLILDYNAQFLGLDALLIASSASSWPVILKAQFLAQASLDLSNRHDVLSLMPLLGLVDQQSVLSSFIKIAHLPKHLLEVASNKKLSYKQACQLTRYDDSYLQWFQTTILPFIDPSCSVFLELLESLHNCFHRLGGIDSLTRALSLDCLHDTTLSSDKRLLMLRNQVFQLCFPTQFKYNEHIDLYIKSLNLPAFISIHWDKSLENKGFKLSADVTSEHDMQALVSTLQQDSLQGLLKEMSYD